MLRAGALPVLLRLIAADNMMVIEVATMVLRSCVSSGRLNSMPSS